MLNGIAPIHLRRRDSRGWGLLAAGYTVAQGYAKLTLRPHVPPDPAPWTAIWRLHSLPKIDMFCWLLCHKKILTDDKLQKRGFHGPSRCSLCRENVECATHLILNCKFTVQVWRELMDYWNPKFVLPTTIPNLFANWQNSYPGPPPRNKVIKKAWSVLPKICCWQIWLERNSRIFRDTKHDVKVVAAKIKFQLKESLDNTKDASNLTQLDSVWGTSLNLQFLHASSNTPLIEDWQIRGKNNAEFQEWISKQQVHSLFFDGASKGNPGRAGAGGIVKNAEGVLIHNFAWGLGINTSIQAEALALLQGLKSLLNLEIKEVNVFGDSQVIIKIMVTNSSPRDLRLARLISRIRTLGNLFKKLSYYHVLRENNKEADLEANKAVLISAGAIIRGEDETWDPIP